MREGGGVAPGAGEKIPSQPVVKTMVRETLHPAAPAFVIMGQFTGPLACW